MVQFIYRLNKVLSIIAGISVSIMMFWIVADILVRMFLNQSILGTSEIIAEYLMVILVFFGLSYTYLHNEHLRVDLVINKLPQLVRRFIEIINHGIVLAVFFYIGWIYLITAMKFQANGTTSSSILAYPLAPALYLLSFGALVLCLTCLTRIIQSILSFRDTKEPQQGVRT